MTELEIEQAIERTRHGCIDEYRALVAAYHQPLRAAVAGYCLPGVDSDEIAHLAFLQAFRNIGQYRAGTDFFAWLCAIARHQLPGGNQAAPAREPKSGELPGGAHY
jgi:DNA-directed RNA polymerase specialized sigma24 family protein